MPDTNDEEGFDSLDSFVVEVVIVVSDVVDAVDYCNDSPMVMMII